MYIGIYLYTNINIILCMFICQYERSDLDISVLIFKFKCEEKLQQNQLQ